MSTTKRTLVLTGARAGMTCTVSKVYDFVNGTLQLHGSTPDVEALTLYLGRGYAAYPEGSTELEDAQRKDAKRLGLEATDGQRSNAQTEEEDAEQRVQRDVQSEGSRSAEKEAPDSSGSDDSVEGQEGSQAPGDGHEDTRLSRIRETLEQLDVVDDSMWTTEGLPRCEVVSALMSETITRADISAAAPNFNREKE